MIIDSDENILSFVSLKFDVITKVKYCLRVTSDLKFHISCNDWIISPKETKSLTIIDSVLMPCIQVREILTFLENYSKGLHSASTYTKSAREFLNCALELRDDEEKCHKIGFLIEQVELLVKIPPKKACITTSIFISLFSMIFHKNKNKHYEFLVSVAL